MAVAIKLFGLMAATAHNAVERVLRGSGAGFACGTDDIALRCRHRLVAKQLHQRVVSPRPVLDHRASASASTDRSVAGFPALKSSRLSWHCSCAVRWDSTR